MAVLLFRPEKAARTTMEARRKQRKRKRRGFKAKCPRLFLSGRFEIEV